MQSTISRTGVNVLSPVRMAERRPTSPEAHVARDHKDIAQTAVGKSMSSDVDAWLTESDAKAARLQFPIDSRSSKLTASSVSIDTSLQSLKADSKESFRTMVSSRSQGLHGVPAAESSSPLGTPRRSPRRSPRHSPLRTELSSARVSAPAEATVMFGPSAGTRVTSSSAVGDSITGPTIATDHKGNPSSTKQTHNNAVDEDLLAQLELLKIQNKLLNSQMQRTQEESLAQLEEERTQRLAAVTELTKRNLLLSEELSASQLAAQQQLQQEKEAFIRAMHTMQAEREELDFRVRQAQERAEKEALQARMQKAQLSETLDQLEQEKSELLKRLGSHAELIKQLQISQIEVAAGSSVRRAGSGRIRNQDAAAAAAAVTVDGAGDGNTGASIAGRDGGSAKTSGSSRIRGSSSGQASERTHVFAFLPTGVEGDSKLAQLQAEVTRMTQSLEKVTQREVALGAALRDSETTATEQHSQLAQQLQTEKERLEARVVKMCAEQQAMHSRLAQAEAAVKEQSQMAQMQATAERAERAAAQAALEFMQKQQQALMDRISEVKSASFTSKSRQTPVPSEKSLQSDSAEVATSGKGSAKAEDEQADTQSSNPPASPTRKVSIKSSSNSPSILNSKVLGKIASTLSLPGADIPLPPSAPPPAAVTQADLDRQLAEMTAAMTQLKRELEQKEALALERERALQEQNAREKEELKRAVQKMREDLLAERRQEEQQQQQYQEGDGGGEGEGYYGEEGYYEGPDGDAQQQQDWEYGYGEGYEGYYGEGYEGGEEWTQEQVDEYYRQYGYEHAEGHCDSAEGGHYDAAHYGQHSDGQYYDGHYYEYYYGGEHSEQHGGGYEDTYQSTADHSSGTVGSGEGVKPLTPVTPVNGPAYTYPPIPTAAVAGAAGGAEITVSPALGTAGLGSGGGAASIGGSPSQAAAKIMLAHGSRHQLRRPSKQGSAVPIGLVSHKSLFELLATDYKPGSHGGQVVGSGKREGLQLQGHRSGGDDGYAIHAMPGMGIEILAPPDTVKAATAAVPVKRKEGIAGVADTSQSSQPSPSPTKLQKGKTIMDLDSDSEEEAWGQDTALKPVSKGSPPKTGAAAAITSGIKVHSKDTSSAPSKPSGPAAAGDKQLSVKEALKERLNRNKRARRKAPFGKAPPGGGAQDRAALDMEKLAGLPAPHAAAAMNDVEKLRGIAAKQPALLQSLDPAQRQPVFYAAAYGRAEALAYLLQTLPDHGLGVQFGLQWIRGDVHGDTPLHAAAASGCAQCTELLLQALTRYPSIQVDLGVQSVADVPNSMHMTPAHLASSAECLDVLYRYKADIEALDTHSRTPLFIACAMNRDHCADYLIQCLDHSVHVGAAANTPGKSGAPAETAEEKLLRKDQRGDTPLHAAACNGAIECLLLLLQHGIDPRRTNRSGLKAIDLAVRNCHQKCKSILAEYHLHYCTSSEFDSVLFLATLEGHRKIAAEASKRGLTSGGTENGETVSGADGDGASGPDEYRIIQANPVEAGSHASHHHKPAKQHSEQTPRQQQQHQQQQQHFSINADTQLGVRKADSSNPFELSPGASMADLAHAAAAATGVGAANSGSNGGAEVAAGGTGSNAHQQQLPDAARTLHHAAQSMFSLRTNKSMRLQKYGAWIAYHDTQSDQMFWYNPETSQGQWEEPTVVTALKLKEATSGTNNVFDKTLTAKMSMRMKRCGDWIEYVTEGGQVFYYNDKDGSFQWEHPLGPEYTRTVAGAAGGGAQNQRGIAMQEANTPWKAYLDPDSGSVFWYNEETHQSQWEMPPELGAEESAEYNAQIHSAVGGSGSGASSALSSARGRARDSLDLSGGQQGQGRVLVGQSQGQGQGARAGIAMARGGCGTGRRSRLRSDSYVEEHVVAVHDHEIDLGI